MARTMQEVRYVGSYPSITSCPKDEKPEYAFIGRSNVGKSSLINMLTGRNGLARISKKPGKTQMINYFLVEQDWYLVDLPGYGYAKISKKKRREWEAFVLIDANIPAQQIDIEFLNWLGAKQVPFAIVYTKIDRLKPAEVQPNIDRIRASFLEHWEALPQEFITTSVRKEGQEEILGFIDGINQEI